jgi:uncharacterized protein (TIGR00269 family)
LSGCGAVVECSCGRRAVFAADRPMCAVHFKEWLTKAIQVELGRFVRESDVLVVAASGGKDSTTLLDVAHSWAKRRGVELHALCIDEGIAGYRDRTLEFLRGFCSDRGIDLHVVSFSDEFGATLDELLERRDARGVEAGACTICGTLRRYLLNREARRLGGTKLLLAHNRDDELQTLLMNLFTGNLPQLSRKGELGGVVDSELFVVRFKPLLDVPEKALAVHALLEYGVPEDECPYLRESARLRARELLNSLESGRPGAKENMMALYDRILPKLKEAAPGFHGELRACASCGEPSSRETCNACLLLSALEA